MLAFLLLTMLQLGGSSIEVEIADKLEVRERGLSGRKELAEGQGMLFVFESPQPLYFQMHETKIPLSIGFFDENKMLIQVEEMEPMSPKLTCSPCPAQYALEVPRGWFEKQGIRLGAKFSFPSSETQVK